MQNFPNFPNLKLVNYVITGKWDHFEIETVKDF